MSDGLTLYKLIILYMLSKVDFPLTNAQLSDFILSEGYTDYFHIQEALSEMASGGLVLSDTIRNASYYQMTEEGEKTLSYFNRQISPAIKNDIEEYLNENKFELRDEFSTQADYVQTPMGDFAVRCRVIEHQESVIDLTINVPSEEEAERICFNWPKHCQDIYMHVIKKLL